MRLHELRTRSVLRRKSSSLDAALQHELLLRHVGEREGMSMTVSVAIDVGPRDDSGGLLVADAFSDDRAAGTVIGTHTTNGVIRAAVIVNGRSLSTMEHSGFNRSSNLVGHARGSPMALSAVRAGSSWLSP